VPGQFRRRTVTSRGIKPLADRRLRLSAYRRYSVRRQHAEDDTVRGVYATVPYTAVGRGGMRK